MTEQYKAKEKVKGQPQDRHQAKAMPRVSDFVESGFGEFYPDAERVSIEEVMAMGDVILLDCLIVDNYQTIFGTHPLAIIAITRHLDQPAITFPSSGQVVVDKLRQLKAKGAMPCLASFVKERSYYDIK